MKRQCKQASRQVLLLEIACIIQLRSCYTPIINDYMDNSHKHLIHCSHNLRILLVRGITKFHLEPNSIHSLKSFQHTASDSSGTSIYCSNLELHMI